MLAPSDHRSSATIDSTAVENLQIAKIEGQQQQEQQEEVRQTMGIDERADLIVRNLQETMGGRETVVKMLERCQKEARTPVVYWGTAITGRPHIAYMIQFLKLADLIQAGCKVKILLADIHGMMDNLKSNSEQLEARLKYYKLLIPQILQTIGVDCNNVDFVVGSSFQKSPEYITDLYMCVTKTTVKRCIKAGSDVVKQVDDPLMSNLIYPIMQCLDEKHLDVDMQLGGVDQRKIFTLSEKITKLVGHRKVVHLMTPILPGLTNEKMTSSDVKTTIDFLDNSKTIKQKLSRSFFDVKDPEKAPIIHLIKHIFFSQRFVDPCLDIETCNPHAEGQLETTKDSSKFSSIDKLTSAIIDGKIHPLAVKDSFSLYLSSFFADAKHKLEENPEFIEAIHKGYDIKL
ncbi:MAG: hypothetical protein MHMPM18_000162 [Marteilia pararefringens]